MNLYDTLNKLNIEYQEVEHEAVYSKEESQKIKDMINGVGCKSLFLHNKNNYYLVLLDDSKQADLKMLANITNENRLSFGNEDKLMEILKLKRGSVTPFGIINDKDNIVTLLIDKYLKNKYILTHPNINTKTIRVFYDDLIKFIEFEKHNYKLF